MSELAVRLIQDDDTKSLDRLMLLNSKVHGEMNSLYDLSLAFLRCDKISQAKKVLQVLYLDNFIAAGSFVNNSHPFETFRLLVCGR